MARNVSHYVDVTPKWLSFSWCSTKTLVGESTEPSDDVENDRCSPSFRRKSHIRSIKNSAQHGGSEPKLILHNKDTQTREGPFLCPVLCCGVQMPWRDG